MHALTFGFVLLKDFLKMLQMSKCALKDPLIITDYFNQHCVAWRSNYTHIKVGCVVTYACSNFSGSLWCQRITKIIKLSLYIWLIIQIVSRLKKGNFLLIKCVCRFHYTDVIMSTMASQITGILIVCSTVCSGADQRNIRAVHHWPLWEEYTIDRLIPLTEGQ